MAGEGQEPHLIVLTTPEFALDPASKEGQLLQLLVVEKVVDRPSAPTRAKCDKNVHNTQRSMQKHKAKTDVTPIPALHTLIRRSRKQTHAHTHCSTHAGKAVEMTRFSSRPHLSLAHAHTSCHSSPLLACQLLGVTSPDAYAYLIIYLEREREREREREALYTTCTRMHHDRDKETRRASLQGEPLHKESLSTRRASPRVHKESLSTQSINGTGCRVHDASTRYINATGSGHALISWRPEARTLTPNRPPLLPTLSLAPLRIWLLRG